VTSPASCSFNLCMKFNTARYQKTKTVNRSHHKFFTHARGHMLPIADDTNVPLSKLLVYSERNSAGQNKRAQRNSSVVPNLRTAEPPPRGSGHIPSQTVSLHLAALRVFCYYFCDKLNVSSSKALLTYQQAVAKIRLSASNVRIRCSEF
jgi:hypothetical protein